MAEEWKEYFEKKLGDFKEEIVHRFHVISEDVIAKVQQVAEGVINLNEKFDRGIASQELLEGPWRFLNICPARDQMDSLRENML